MNRKLAVALAVLCTTLFCGAAMAQIIDDTALWGTQWVVGNGWTSSLVLKNDGQTPKTTYLGLLAKGGSLTPWNMVEALYAGSSSYRFKLELQPGQTLTLPLTPVSLNLTQGWLFVAVSDGDGNDGISGEIVRKYGTTEYKSNLAKPAFNYIFEGATWHDGTGTALAVTNQESYPFFGALITIAIFDEKGNFVAQTEPRYMKPGEHQVGFLGDFFVGNVQWESYLQKNLGQFRGKVIVLSYVWPVTFAAFNF